MGTDKWEAWKALEDMSKETAEKTYVEMATQVLEKEKKIDLSENVFVDERLSFVRAV